MLRVIELWSTWNLSCPPPLKKKANQLLWKWNKKYVWNLKQMQGTFLLVINVFFENVWHVLCLVMHEWMLNLQIRRNLAQFMLNLSLLPRWSILSWSFYIYIRKRISKFVVCSVYLKHICKLRCKIIVLYRCH